MPANPVSPWKEFLDELDSLLREPIKLHCIGGFAVVAAYGLPRSTNDLDYFSLEPYNRARDLQDIAGEGSPLARKYKVHVHHAAVATVPENYETRLTQLFPARFKNLGLFVLDPYKLSRNLERDREDVSYLANTKKLYPSVLRERYEKELRANLIGPPGPARCNPEVLARSLFRKGGIENDNAPLFSLTSFLCVPHVMQPIPRSLRPFMYGRVCSLRFLTSRGKRSHEVCIAPLYRSRQCLAAVSQRRCSNRHSRAGLRPA